MWRSSSEGHHPCFVLRRLLVNPSRLLKTRKMAILGVRIRYACAYPGRAARRGLSPQGSGISMENGGGSGSPGEPCGPPGVVEVSAKYLMRPGATAGQGVTGRNQQRAWVAAARAHLEPTRHSSGIRLAPSGMRSGTVLAGALTCLYGSLQCTSDSILPCARHHNRKRQATQLSAGTEAEYWAALMDLQPLIGCKREPAQRSCGGCEMKHRMQRHWEAQQH